MRAPASAVRLSAEELFRSHAGFVARFLTRLGVHRDDLDDLIQEVFLLVHARGGYEAGPAKPTSYLGTIALHAALNARQRRRRAGGRSAEAAPDELSSAALDPAQKLEVTQSLRKVQQALATLSPVLCATLLLAEQDGESCTSIAASMDVPVGTVYWRLHQARRGFRRALEAQQEAESGAQVALSKGVAP